MPLLIISWSIRVHQNYFHDLEGVLGFILWHLNEVDGYATSSNTGFGQLHMERHYLATWDLVSW
jgi:cell division protein FtsI/penicillin-binding protein 2